MPATKPTDLIPAAGRWRSRAVVCLLALGLLVFTWWFVLAKIDADRAVVAASAERDLANLTRVTQENALRTFQNAEQLLRLLQTGFEAAGDRFDLQTLAGPGVVDSEIVNLMGVFDTKGNLLLSNRPVEGRVNVADRDYFKAHATADSGRMSIARPVLGRASGKWAIQLSRRINLKNGDFGGVAFVSLNAAYFTRFYGDLDLGQSGVSVLVNQEGIVLARKSGNQDQYGIDISTSPIVQQMNSGLVSGMFLSHSVTDGIERLYFFRKVLPYPVTVVAGISVEEMNAGHRQNREALLLQAALASALILALATAFTLYESALRGRVLFASTVGLEAASVAIPKKRSLLVVFVALVLLVPLLGWVIVRSNTPQLERDAFATLEGIAALKAEAIENWLAERYGDALIVSKSQGLIAEIAAFQQGDQRQRDYILARMQALREVYTYANVQLHDTHGQMLLSLTAHRHLSEQTRAALVKALAGGQPQSTGLFVDAADGDPQIDMVVPLQQTSNGQRKAVGALILHIDPRHFLFPYVQRWPITSPSGETLLARREGDSVVFINPLRHSKAAPLSLRQPLNESTRPTSFSVRTGQTGSMAGIDYRGVSVLAAYRPVKGTDWHLVSKLDRDEVLAPLWRLVSWVSLVATAALGMIGAAMWLLWRQQAQARQFEAQSSRLLQHFYELPFIGMAITSPESKRWLKFNDRLCEIVGYSRDELPGKNWGEMTHPDDIAKDLTEFERVLSGDSDGYELEKRFIRKDGKVVDCEVAVRCVRRRDGSVDFILATVQDISERMQAGRELLRSNQELEQFSYSISHDMRQPLRMISSYLQLLDMGLADRLDNEQREYLDFAVDGARRLDQMLIGLLEYSRVGRKGEPAAWVDSRTLLDEALLFLRPAIDEAQADVQVLGEWPRLRVRPDEFLRLLQNLIGNALKFRIAGRLPEVHISSRTEGGEWRLSIADNGVGIAAGQIGRLFQVFQRLQSRIDYEGTGIGLAICRKIVEHHGGRIWVESAGEGQGSRFCVTLPVRESESPEQPLEPALLPGALA